MMELVAGPALYTATVVFVGLWILLVGHEAGHVVAARMGGIPVRFIQLGSGPGATFHVGATPVRLGMMPSSGLVVGDPRHATLTDWSWFTAGGPVASVVVGLTFWSVLFVAGPPMPAAWALLLLGLASFAVAFASTEGKIDGVAVQADLNKVRRMRELRTLPGDALEAAFGPTPPGVASIDALRRAASERDENAAIGLAAAHLLQRLGDGFGPEIGDALLRLAEVLPPEAADAVRNAVVYQAATECWPDRGGLLPVAERLRERHPDSVAFVDTCASLLTSLGRGAEALPLLAASADAVGAFPEWMPGRTEQVGVWHSFMAVALDAAGGPPAEVDRHLAAAEACGVAPEVSRSLVTGR
jgi:hypothetical protein